MDAGRATALRRLRVGLLAPPWVAVPPPLYGGTEAVIDTLARGLVAAGHEVVLFASGDSTCPVPRRWAYARALGTTHSTQAELHHVQEGYAALADRVDVVHDHTTLGPEWALVSDGIPVVATNHGPFLPDLVERYTVVAERIPIVAISRAHAAEAGSLAVRAVVHHGIDVQRFPVGAGDGGYVLFLGRMSPDKGPQRAIAAARSAGMRIVLAAKMWEPAERRFFAEEVEPLLGPDALYVGEVGGRAKLDLLGGAVALLNPIRWPEPFGLVMIEALACGTPVVSFRDGSAPEIVEDAVSGFLCDDEEDMAHALGRIGSIDRWRCRARVETRFSAERMVRDYLALYEEVVGSGRDQERPRRGARASANSWAWATKPT